MPSSASLSVLLRTKMRYKRTWFCHNRIRQVGCCIHQLPPLLQVILEMPNLFT